MYYQHQNLVGIKKALNDTNRPLVTHRILLSLCLSECRDMTFNRIVCEAVIPELASVAVRCSEDKQVSVNSVLACRLLVPFAGKSLPSFIKLINKKILSEVELAAIAAVIEKLFSHLVEAEALNVSSEDALRLKDALRKRLTTVQSETAKEALQRVFSLLGGEQLLQFKDCSFH